MIPETGWGRQGKITGTSGFRSIAANQSTQFTGCWESCPACQRSELQRPQTAYSGPDLRLGVSSRPLLSFAVYDEGQRTLQWLRHGRLAEGLPMVDGARCVRNVASITGNG